MVNAAIGGQNIDSLLNNQAYWTTAQNMLANSGNTFAQVQVVWFKEITEPNSMHFPAFPIFLKDKFKSAIQLLKFHFPNLKLCYLTDLRYCDNSNNIQHADEPYCWATGWAVKWLIEDQLQGDTALRFRGTNAIASWLAWGPNIWTDGETPRQTDGLNWLCPQDYQVDGIHYSPAGKLKHAQLLLDFFSTDPTAVPWFLAPATPLCPDVTNPDVSHLKPTAVRLNWDTSLNAVSYSIRGRNVNAANWTLINIPPGSPNYFNAAGLVNNNTYIWQIIAYCDTSRVLSSSW